MLTRQRVSRGILHMQTSMVTTLHRVMLYRPSSDVASSGKGVCTATQRVRCVVGNRTVTEAALCPGRLQRVKKPVRDAVAWGSTPYYADFPLDRASDLR